MVYSNIVARLQAAQPTFMLEYYYKACEFGIKEQIVKMAINSRGTWDTARVLKINKNTVTSTLKNNMALNKPQVMIVEQTSVRN